jgi:bifunctional non-homologous end joining protein LigD
MAKTGVGKSGTVQFGEIRLSSPGRVIYPELGITKLEVAEYYEAAADWLLPHFRDRPLTLVRCPDTYQKCFFQKHIDENKAYAWVQPVAVKEEKGETHTYLAVNSIAGVLSLVQLGALEFHTWGSRKDKLEYPDKFTLDIDPDPSVSWPRIVKSAHTIRELLLELGLQSFAKTTGGKGLHVVVPLQRRRIWDDVFKFTEAVAGLLVQAAPKHYTTSLAKSKRVGKILVDYLRNARGATAVEAYSTRARPGATISTPVHWDEVTPSLKPDQLNVRTLPKRLDSLKEDPWEGYNEVKQTITAKTMTRLGLI